MCHSQPLIWQKRGLCPPRKEPCGDHYSLLHHQLLRGDAASSKDSIPLQVSHPSLARPDGRNRKRSQQQCKNQHSSPDFCLLDCLLVYFLHVNVWRGFWRKKVSLFHFIRAVITSCLVISLSSVILYLSESVWTTYFCCHYGKLWNTSLFCVFLLTRSVKVYSFFSSSSVNAPQSGHQIIEKFFIPNKLKWKKISLSYLIYPEI